MSLTSPSVEKALAQAEPYAVSANEGTGYDVRIWRWKGLFGFVVYGMFEPSDNDEQTGWSTADDAGEAGIRYVEDCFPSVDRWTRHHNNH